MNRVLGFLLLALPAFAAVDGVVVNRTTGNPQPGATVTLYKLGQAGMESLESVRSDGQGKFLIQATAAGGPHLVQAAFEGVTYNKMITPGAPTSGLEVEVFAATPLATTVRVKQHVFILEPSEGRLQVAENIVYENTGTRSFNDPVGSVRFTLPPEAEGKVRVMCEGPNGMPIERTAKLTKDNIYVVDFPIKPGETRIQANYDMIMGTPPVWAVKLLHKEGETRLATPSGVTLKGDGIKEIGREPRSQAVIYEAAGPIIKAEVEGSGAIRGPEQSDETPRVEEIMPRIHDRWQVVVGLAAAILALGIALLYRTDVQSPASGQAQSGKDKPRG